MPAKKKAPNKVQKAKKPAITKRGLVTTVDSTPKRGNHHTTRPTSTAPKIPPEKSPVKSPVKVVYPQRERRVNPEGRRGRYAEKTPPGTRTKMLKIIYDRKAEMARKRQQALIGKVILGILLVTSLYYGAQHAIDLANQGVNTVVEMLDLQGWWSNVATGNTKSNPQYRVRPRQHSQNTLRSGSRYAPARKQVKQHYRRPPARTKYVSSKKTYRQTRAYRGR